MTTSGPVFCAYCSVKVVEAGDYPDEEDVRQLMVDHAVACEHRPELKLIALAMELMDDLQAAALHIRRLERLLRVGVEGWWTDEQLKEARDLVEDSDV